MPAIKEIRNAILDGSVIIPPSKSITHRLMIINALSDESSTITNPLYSEDTIATAEGLKNLGYSLNLVSKRIVFNGKTTKQDKEVKIDVKNSGTSARFLAAVSCLSEADCIIDGSQRMQERPMMPLIGALKTLGAKIKDTDGHLPLKIFKSALHGRSIKVDASQSSQFLSALVLICPYLQEKSIIIHENMITSRPYFEMTLNLIQRAGIRLENQTEQLIIPGEQKFLPLNIAVEGDFSSAAYFLVGTIITGGLITCENIAADSIQGDKIILNILAQTTSSNIEIQKNTLKISGGDIFGLDFDMRDYPDLIPTVSVLCLFAKKKSRLRNVTILKYKESDRLRAITENIARIGGNSYIEGNDLIIEPKPLRSATLESYNDHRIAMSFALVGLKIPGIRIKNSMCVQKSYPTFWNDFERLSKIN